MISGISNWISRDLQRSRQAAWTRLSFASALWGASVEILPRDRIDPVGQSALLRRKLNENDKLFQQSRAPVRSLRTKSSPSSVFSVVISRFQQLQELVDWQTGWRFCPKTGRLEFSCYSKIEFRYVWVNEFKQIPFCITSFSSFLFAAALSMMRWSMVSAATNL